MAVSVGSVAWRPAVALNAAALQDSRSFNKSLFNGYRVSAGAPGIFKGTSYGLRLAFMDEEGFDAGYLELGRTVASAAGFRSESAVRTQFIVAGIPVSLQTLEDTSFEGNRANQTSLSYTHEFRPWYSDASVLSGLAMRVGIQAHSDQSRSDVVIVSTTGALTGLSSFGELRNRETGGLGRLGIGYYLAVSESLRLEAGFLYLNGKGSGTREQNTSILFGILPIPIGRATEYDFNQDGQRFELAGGYRISDSIVLRVAIADQQLRRTVTSATTDTTADLAFVLVNGFLTGGPVGPALLPLLAESRLADFGPLPTSLDRMQSISAEIQLRY
ncbi:MAG: hypothetical protein K1X75_01765 [Leptospirales bacterium]|nr:hypothetical protein [Leptospirales bacterium]